ncbi:hypothetical protein [Pseudanabaena mucicola]|uniref:Uncharacterized protein n=1 Tax=Pseudanabaena mucicola FACHB-723 TaxID=2692860 RepID=A0ABR7ZYN7_9CYAN|nr:hypothetical protein [Pseudanabaena mucicola]MBD2188694.1 hypothetical protein [Pseudanabaena mucicola FACHB-723]
MQVSPSHSQRQLVSGKVGWGWRQATYPISVNFVFAGLLILMLSISQLLQLGASSLVDLAFLVVAVGFVIGLYSAKSVVEVCRQNTDYVFLRSQLIAITAYWLILIAGLSIEKSNKIWVAFWWILPAAIFTGIASSLILRSGKSKTNPKLQTVEPASIDTLNVITYSDQTVLISPSAIGQQPRQFNSLILIVMGLFFWTMLDFSTNLKAIAAITLTATGLTGFFTWQAQLRLSAKVLELKFSGLWGLTSEYAIDLRSFSCLSLIKLQEASGELTWMQLTGSKIDITLPLAMTTLPSSMTKDVTSQSDQFGQTIREQFHLANQETERDSLGLANVLLPQGAGILAGTAFISVGGLLLFIFPLPSEMTVATAIAWLGVLLLSPMIARFMLQLVATNSLQSDRHDDSQNHLYPWEIGISLLLVSIFLTAPNTNTVLAISTFNQVLPLLTLIFGWLGISIGICILAFVRRTPLWHLN